MFIGDSITAGKYFQYSKIYPNNYSVCAVGAGEGTQILTYLESNCNHKFNTPYVGDNTNFLGSFSNYKTAVIQFGVNDLAGNKSSEEIINRYNKIISFLKNKGINNIIILTILPTTNNTGNNLYKYENIKDRLDIVNNYLRNLQNVIIIDSYESLSLNNEGNTNYFSDGIHPNNNGKKVLSNLLDNVIEIKSTPTLPKPETKGAETKGKKYLFIGTSTTVGQYFKYWKEYSNSATCAVGAGQATHVLNYLKSNCTLSAANTCKNCSVSNKNFTGNFSDYDTAVLYLGLNDLGIVSADELKKRISNIITFLNEKGIKNIVVLTIAPTTTRQTANSRMPEVNYWIMSKIDNRITIAIDTYKLFVNPNGTVNSSLLRTDGYHPNDAAYKLMSRELDLHLLG